MWLLLLLLLLDGWLAGCITPVLPGPLLGL